uniref:Pericentrin/AKAP-450 centrosomal targeting domain-containing protein n=1 Tax=Timema monikensis TaxID=170555 RepID=A0A7R9E7G2_9NEOP|nr:unnamed protein product [Timema monikensis]
MHDIISILSCSYKLFKTVHVPSPGSLDELSGQVQKELEESAKLELSLLEKLGAAEEREYAHPDSALSLPATPLEKILHKILHIGIDMLTFAELSMLHQVVCSATSQMILQEGTPRLGFEVPEMPVTIPGLAPDDKRVLLQRVAALEVEVMKRHQEKQKKVYELESNLRKEKKRLHEMREVLNNEQRHNLELQNRIGLQSQSMADLEVQRDILQRRSSYHESRVHEYIGLLETERSKVRSLEDDLSKERGHVKHLEALLEEERKRLMEAKLKDSSFIESMRQQLDTALDSETKLRRKLVDQVPHRDRDMGSCRCNYALAETTTAKLTEIKEELCHERVRVVELEAALASGREMLLDLEIREEKSRKQVDTEREVSARLQTEVSEYKAELGALRAELDMKAYSLQELEVLREHRNKNRQQLESLHRRKLSLEQKLSALQQQQLTTQSSSRNVTPVDDIKQDQVEGFVSPIYSSQQITTLSPALHANEECLMTQLADAQRQLSALKNRLAAHDEELSLLTKELAVSRQREAELERRVTPEGQEPETSPLLKIGKVGHKGGTNTTIMCPQYKVSSFGSDQSLKEEKGISEVVSQLNKEKEELVNALKVAQDREQSNAKSWADEKAALIRAVLAAEADVDNIHSQEMRNVELTVTDMDERVAHLFGKYLRSESYRKALVWQKRYLLVVLGGYQECEALTLDRLAFLSGCSQDNGRTRSPKNKFRSAVLVVVVIQRMKYLVRRWKHGRRLGGNAVLNRLHTESVASSTRSSYNDSLKLWGSGLVNSQNTLIVLTRSNKGWAWLWQTNLRDVLNFLEPFDFEHKDNVGEQFLAKSPMF